MRGLLERADELKRLEGLVERAQAGYGSVALLVGPAGIGKTSVLDAVRSFGVAAGLRTLPARAGLLERDLAWSVVRHLFAPVITADAGRRAELLSGASALARPALGLPGSEGEAAGESGTLHGLYWLTAALADERPLLLAVDDGHWADLPSLRFLAYLGHRVADLPLLLVVTLRSGEEIGAHLQALEWHGAANRITLRELSAGATATLTREALGAGAAEEFCAACHTASGGNPFILHELLGHIAADGITPQADNAAVVARVTPEGVKRSVLLHLSSRSDAACELARAVAVMTVEPELRAAAALASLDSATAATAADALVKAGILAPGTPLRFVHPLVREVVYTELAGHERARRHREAARRLAELGADQRRIAVHLTRSAPAGDAWVVETLRSAAQAALAHSAPQPAADFLRRALAEPPAPELKATLLSELAAAEALSGSQVAMELLEQALAKARDPQVYERIAVELLLIRFRHGQMHAAIELARELISGDAVADQALKMRMIAAAVTGSILVPSLRSGVDFFLAQIPDNLDDATPAGRLALSARLADACARRAPMDEIGDLAERALGGGILLQELPAHELLYWNATSALTVADRFEAARLAIDAAFAESRRRGSIVGFALCSCFRCKLHQRTGDITAGTADGWQALTASPADVPQIRAYTAAFLVECLIERGELEEAIQVVTTPEFRGEMPELFGYHLMRASRGQARIALGEVEAGVEELLAVGGALGDQDFGPAMCPWRSRAAVGLMVLGRVDEARALAAEELSLAERSASAWGRVAALQAVAATERERTPELLAEAIAISSHHGFELERARCLVLLGAHHRRRGQRRLAAELLQEGLEAAVVCGALALEERAAGELIGVGLHPRRRREEDRELLTPAERRVAELAAEGLSNREIAQALFVSLRTVETHLTHTYQKLGIDSRAGLAEALGEMAPVA